MTHLIMNHRFDERYLLVFFELLFLGFAYQAVIIEDTTRFYVVLVSMLLVLLPLVLEMKFSISLPFGTKVMIASALFLHVAGGINRYYWIYMPYYDKIAHCVSAIALGLVIFSFFLLLDYWEIHIQPSRIYAGIFILVFFFGMGWEISEYFIDILVKSSYNNGLTDSFFDVLSNTVGAILAILIAERALRKLSSDEYPSSLLLPKKDKP